jgi:hypothetical protein
MKRQLDAVQQRTRGLLAALPANRALLGGGSRGPAGQAARR